LLAIARAPESHLHPIQELSKAENIPVKFLEQILLTLRHAGILTSRRGVRGGYSWARSPSQITVGEIVRLMDGPFAPVPCASSSAVTGETCTCPHPMRCSLRLLMIDVRDHLSEVLDKRTIAEVAALVPSDAPIEFQI
jgi:Rrf2 family protein